MRGIGWVQRVLAGWLGALARHRGQRLAVWAIGQLGDLDARGPATDCLIEELPRSPAAACLLSMVL